MVELRHLMCFVSTTLTIVQTLVPAGSGGAGQLLLRTEQQGQLSADAHGCMRRGQRRQSYAALCGAEDSGAGWYGVAGKHAYRQAPGYQ